MKRIVVILNIWRLIIPMIVYASDTKFRDLIRMDLKKFLYSEPQAKSNLYWMLYMLVFRNPFHAVFYFRMRMKHNLCRAIQSVLLPDKRETEITGDIGPGLLIFHGQATIIHCAKAGKNLEVFQSVTIGRNPSHNRDGRDIPVIGDNVTIYTGSIVSGGINIGNNVQIGAGSVVMKDVPDNCVVVGNPARIIKHNGHRSDESLSWNK
ncbi:serine O-acetyltransferase [Bifidobacterium vespertilionis]|uniref:serine O-acetyltransferase n=1 Tax=Bifidobacterium vespertilionis TaxID=2562524 RepID=UPI001BDBD57E|nr:serine acetyltransferase [Bifidobacterium vespertilionis]MBT1179932.1 serine acetyltransferase [Bifidobacterium vespertilionis]